MSPEAPGGSGARTYGASGSEVYGIFSVGDGEIAFSTVISGNSMSGTWAKYNVDGDQGALHLTKQ